jgi:hypothetical protein
MGDAKQLVALVLVDLNDLDRVALKPGDEGGVNPFVAVDNRSAVVDDGEGPGELIPVGRPDDAVFRGGCLGIVGVWCELAEVQKLDALSRPERRYDLRVPNIDVTDIFAGFSFSSVEQNDTSGAVVEAGDPPLKNAVIGVDPGPLPPERAVERVVKWITHAGPPSYGLSYIPFEPSLA